MTEKAARGLDYLALCFSDTFEKGSKDIASPRYMVMRRFLSFFCLLKEIKGRVLIEKATGKDL